MPETATLSRSPLATLCSIAAAYGIGFGLLMVPAGLFLNFHILAAALAHILIGGAFLTAGSAIRRRKPWAFPLAASCASLTSAIGFTAAYGSASCPDNSALFFWLPFALFFLGFAILALRQWSYTGARQSDA